jgi:hypothetical protein
MLLATESRTAAYCKVTLAFPAFPGFSPGVWQSWRMRLTDRLSQPQRIVVVVALGVACGTAGIYLVNLGSTVSFGWYAYAPLFPGGLSAAHGAGRMAAPDHLAGAGRPVGAGVHPGTASLPGSTLGQLAANGMAGRLCRIRGRPGRSHAVKPRQRKSSARSAPFSRSQLAVDDGARAAPIGYGNLARGDVITFIDRLLAGRGGCSNS